MMGVPASGVRLPKEEYQPKPIRTERGIYLVLDYWGERPRIVDVRGREEKDAERVVLPHFTVTWAEVLAWSLWLWCSWALVDWRGSIVAPLVSAAILLPWFWWRRCSRKTDDGCYSLVYGRRVTIVWPKRVAGPRKARHSIEKPSETKGGCS